MHFTSGAAGLHGQANRAFDWPHEWSDQLERTREQFLGENGAG
jgi:hypothetical protein